MDLDLVHCWFLVGKKKDYHWRRKQARKLGRCDSNLQNLKALLTHSLTHSPNDQGRC